MQWGVVLMVALGGALGSLARYFVAGAVQPAWWPGFPFGIFVVNITGGLMMGLIAGLAALKLNLTPEMRAFLTTGILGGYTTFSTFSLDSAMLMERGAYAQAGAYITGSVVLSILALFAGLWLVRAVYA
ncbi:MAG: fluoride efflux transporter CrcB [Proteobacteria bacterium]|nr:fluoride efflux transporter CrcB [Pseudomonadota bacterium]